MLTREEWTREPGTPPVVKGLVWCTDRSRTMEGDSVRVYDQYLGRRLNISLGKRATVFFRSRYMLSWPVFIKFKRMLGQRNTLVFALIIRWL
jgi:hypothetical protein